MMRLLVLQAHLLLLLAEVAAVMVPFCFPALASSPAPPSLTAKANPREEALCRSMTALLPPPQPQPGRLKK